MNRRILEYFGLYGKGLYMDDVFRTFSKDIQNAVNDDAMIAIVGAPGAGKTVLLKDALLHLRQHPDKQPIEVRVVNKFKEKVTIAQILNAIVWEISAATPRRDLEARSRQVVRLMGQRRVAEQRRIVLIIEEAHRLHTNTLRALKELREDEFAGQSPLLSVILIGHEELGLKLEQRKEVFWRCQRVELSESVGWMNYDSRVKYLRAVYGEAISATARRRIATIKHVPLEMDFYVEQKMQEVHLAGLEKLDDNCFEVSPQELKEALGVSLQEIAKEAGVGKTTVHDVLIGHNTRQSPAVREALERLAEKKRHEEQQKEAV